MKATKGKVDTRKGKKEELKPVVEDRTLGKRKAAIKADNSRRKLTKKAKLVKKDVNKPKRPPSAFFVFLEEFRTIYKQEHPNVKAVSAVGKAGGEKWKSLSSAVNLALWLSYKTWLYTTKQLFDDFSEKAPYEAKAAKRKSDYEKLIAAYNKKQDNTDEEEEESEKSKSNVNEEDEEETGEEDDGGDDEEED